MLYSSLGRTRRWSGQTILRLPVKFLSTPQDSLLVGNKNDTFDIIIACIALREFINEIHIGSWTLYFSPVQPLEESPKSTISSWP